MKIFKKVAFFKIFMFVSIAGILTSCVLTPNQFHEVKYHDLGNPLEINQGGPYVEFDKFTINGPYKTKMVFRAGNNELLINEYHRWAQSPESMIGRYLAIAFRSKPPGEDIKKYSVKGEILVFEADEEKSQANLIIEYTIMEPYQGRKKSFSRTFTEDLEKVKPQQLATGMSAIAVKLAEQLKKDMLGMK